MRRVHGQICAYSKLVGFNWTLSNQPRGFGCRIHCGVEVTESSTNKRHTHSLPQLHFVLCFHLLILRRGRCGASRCEAGRAAELRLQFDKSLTLP